MESDGDEEDEVGSEEREVEGGSNGKERDEDGSDGQNDEKDGGDGKEREKESGDDDTTPEVDESAASPDRTGRAWYWTIFVLIPLSIVWAVWPSSAHLPPAPPCHVQRNPNNLVPCAIAVDLNRALSAIPHHVRPGSPDDLFADRADLEDHHMCWRTFHGRYVQPAYEWYDKLDLIIYTATKMEVADSPAAQPHSPVSYIFRLLFDRAGLLRQETAAARSTAKNLLRRVHTYARQRHPERQEAIDHARRLVQRRIAHQQHINREVYRLSREIGRISETRDIMSALESLRPTIIRLLLSEAVLTCWLEGVEQLESELYAWSRKVWKDGQLFLHRVRYTKNDIRRLRRTITDQAQQWSDEAERIIDDAHSSGFAAERSCAKRWAESKIGYCVANRTDGNVYQNWTALDPSGSGCISHPDPTLWEWHNATPMNLSFHDEEHAMIDIDQPFPCSSEADRDSRCARFWHHRVFTHVDLAKYIRVDDESKRGVVIQFNAHTPLLIGPLRFLTPGSGKGGQGVRTRSTRSGGDDVDPG